MEPKSPWVTGLVFLSHIDIVLISIKTMFPLTATYTIGLLLWEGVLLQIVFQAMFKAFVLTVGMFPAMMNLLLCSIMLPRSPNINVMVIPKKQQRRSRPQQVGTMGGAKSKYSPGDNSQDNNATGFNAMPAGTGTGTESAWFGHDAWFWTTTGSDKGRGATSIRISYGSPTISRGNFYNGYFKENQFSVRCVRGSGTLNVEELFLRLNALAQRKNQSSHNTSKKSTVWDLFCYSKPADYSNVFLYPELYPELFIKSSSSSSDASSSSSTSQPTTTTPSNKLCERCHGSGREVRIDSGPCVGLDNKYCDECKQTVPCSHYHVTCQLCGGKGYR